MLKISQMFTSRFGLPLSLLSAIEVLGVRGKFEISGEVFEADPGELI